MTTGFPIHQLYRATSDRCYVWCKLRTDPLYSAISRQLAGNSQPLLDIGCGLGLLAHYLRCHGFSAPVLGLDYDSRKIRAATAAAEAAGDASLTFREFDARQPLPEHRGNVTILDILQFFTPAEQETLLRDATTKLEPGGQLIIRSGLEDPSLRFSITRAADHIARATRWMRSAPVHYPTAESIRRILSPSGTVEITPLSGKIPFNNHLIVLRPRSDNYHSPVFHSAPQSR